MKKIKSIYIYILTFVVILFGNLSKANAQLGGNVNAIKGPLSGDLASLFNDVTGLLRFGIILTFIGVMIAGGYTRMTAGGNAEKEEKAIKIFTGGIVGFLITALAPVIVDIVLQLIKAPGL